MTYVIYSLVCKNQELCSQKYIGLTKDIQARGHSHNSKSRIEDYKVYKTIREFGGFQNWDIIPIEYLDENITLENAKLIEDEYITDFGELNMNRSVRLENAKYLYSQKYRNLHKDKLKIFEKQYYIDNVIRINNRKKVKNVCEICNGHYTTNNKAQHYSSNKHKIAS